MDTQKLILSNILERDLSGFKLTTMALLTIDLNDKGEMIPLNLHSSEHDAMFYAMTHRECYGKRLKTGECLVLSNQDQSIIIPLQPFESDLEIIKR